VRVVKGGISRREVITFYVGYDCRKKQRAEVASLDSWPWDNPDGLDECLRSCGLKPGVLAAYHQWWLVQLDLIDLLDCAIVNSIFHGHPQVLSQLIDRGLLETAMPRGTPEWWEPLSSGHDFPPEWALILRPAVASERPAKWYLEDGSGRALALLRRILTHQEPWRTAWGYLGVIPDEHAGFIRTRPEVSGN
jgi:hypothetical protein